jgi:hypothetical protein
MARGSKKKYMSLSIQSIAVAALLGALGQVAYAQDAASPGDAINAASMNAVASDNSDSPPANLNDETERMPYRKYSNNAKTNERLNAVFGVIQAEGNGLIWDGRNDDVPPVALSAIPPKATPSPALKSDIAKAAFASNAPTAAKPAPITTATAQPPIIATPPIPAVGGATAATPVLAQAALPAPAVAATPVIQTWTIPPNATLRETLAAWSRAAGWKEPTWKTDRPYTVAGKPIEGTFVDALRAVAAAAPLIDINASMYKRELTISDHRTN